MSAQNFLSNTPSVDTCDVVIIHASVPSAGTYASMEHRECPFPLQLCSHFPTLNVLVVFFGHPFCGLDFVSSSPLSLSSTTGKS